MKNHISMTRKREKISIIILACLFIFLQFIIDLLPKYHLTMYKGVIASFQYGLCLLILKRNQKIGSRLSIGLMSFELLYVLIDVLWGSHGMLAGVFNIFFYLITLILISRYNNAREIDNRTDLITGALNQRGLILELENHIQKNKEFSIIYISLDNFKAINDGFGHAFGDELLKKIIKRMNFRFANHCTVARIGGAEFVVIVDGEKNVKEIADRLLVTISEKSILVVDNTHVDCFASCHAGIARFPQDAKDHESLVKYADIAMSSAIADKSKEAYIFDVSMLESMNRQIHVENLVKNGLIRKQFYLVYQPQYKVNQKKLRGFETLIRLRTDDGEFVSPGEFIPIAEKNDLILQIDEYVLFNAMTEFREIVLQNPELMISVNVSAKDFADEWFVKKIKKLLKETQFPAKNLEIEITEYCMVTSMDITVENINKLREMKIQIALDDFGTGYTSLDYVSRLPIDLLKIDKSLIDDIENNKKRRDFAHAVINMGQLMDCEVISEGVENDKQVNYLKDYGCDLIQGFVWGKPLIFEDAKKLISGE